MKKVLVSLFLLAVITGCQQQTAGNCNLGAKSGGSVNATAAECKELGGRYNS